MIQQLNLGAACLAVLLSMAAGLNLTFLGRSSRDTPAEAVASPRTVDLGNGQRGLIDANGSLVPLAPYRRIVSGSTVADSLLLELASPERIRAFSIYSDDAPGGGHRYEGKPRLDPLEDLEGLLALKPDLLLLNTHGSPAKIARLEKAGLRVFNLGQMNGLDSYTKSARVVATLLGHPERGMNYARTFSHRMSRISPPIPEAAKKTAAYVAIYGGKMFGGAAHTSYDDVITHAGLENVAATSYQGWPEYDAERLLEMNPQIIVTVEGMRRPLCRHEGLARLQACRSPENLVELPRSLIGNPASGMLPAAEALHAAVYGSSNSRR